MKQRQSIVRVQQSWLAQRERVVLVFLASRMPVWIKPDHLTLLGLLGSLLSFIGFAATSTSGYWLWVASLGIVVNWAGDSLDGNLARLRRTERPQYGFFVDHISDVVSQLLVFMGLAASPYVRFESGCLLLLSYWLASLFTFIRTISSDVFQISYFRIGPTEIRIGLLLYIVSIPTLGTMPIATPWGAQALMDVLAMLIFAIVLASFLVMALCESRRLAVIQPSPQNAASPRQPLEPMVPARPNGAGLVVADNAAS